MDLAIDDLGLAPGVGVFPTVEGLAVEEGDKAVRGGFFLGEGGGWGAAEQAGDDDVQGFHDVGFREIWESGSWFFEILEFPRLRGVRSREILGDFLGHLAGGGPLGAAQEGDDEADTFEGLVSWPSVVWKTRPL